MALWEERQLREREGPKLAYELRKEARARELRVSEVVHEDLLDPDARTPLLMVVVGGLISLELKDLRR